MILNYAGTPLALAGFDLFKLVRFVNAVLFSILHANHDPTPFQRRAQP
jgi:hypothetical protein